MLRRGQSEDLRQPHGVIENALKIFEKGAQLPFGYIHGHSQFFWFISEVEAGHLFRNVSEE
jgi:hypothetical protein